MWMRWVGWLVLTAVLFWLMVCPTSWADSQGIHKDLRKGWFWYQDPDPTVEEDVYKEEAPQEESRPGQTDQVSQIRTYTPQEMMKMHPDLLKAHLEIMLKRAVHEPTLEHVKDYYEVQDVVRRKALAFANVSTALMRMHPELSGDVNTAPVAKKLLLAARSADISETILDAKDNFALVYFYEPDCLFCRQQSSILQHFELEYGWLVRRVQLSEAAALAEKFGIETVPYIILVSRQTGKHIPVGYGVVTLNKFTRNVYQGIRFINGEVSPEQFNIYGPDEKTMFDPSHVTGF